MRKTVAVIAVQNPKTFAWFGHMPIMNWSFTKVTEVRGIDTILCVAASGLVSRARKLLGDEVETIQIPDHVTEGVFDKWLVSANGPAVDGDIVVVVQPTLPFLPAAKIEACVEYVRRHAANTTCTVREATNVVSALSSRASGFIEVRGCRAFAPIIIREPSAAPRKFKPVPVSLIESLDMCDPDNRRIADALLVSGAV